MNESAIVEAINDLRDDFCESMKEIKQLIRELIDAVVEER